MKVLNGFQIKLLALVLMVMDHLYISFPQVFPLWFHPLSRIAAPAFAFLLVEGFFHTKSKLLYNFRLFSFAIFMMIGNGIINAVLSSKDIYVHNNIFLTLALGLTIMNILEISKTKRGKKKNGLIIAVIILIALGMFNEGGLVLIPFILITYFFRGNRKKELLGYAVLSILLFMTNYVAYPTLKETIDMLLFNSDFLFILVVPFIILYNGQRGPSSRFAKYLFYIFYPLHLWTLAIIKALLVN